MGILSWAQNKIAGRGGAGVLNGTQTSPYLPANPSFQSGPPSVPWLGAPGPKDRSAFPDTPMGGHYWRAHMAEAETASDYAAGAVKRTDGMRLANTSGGVSDTHLEERYRRWGV